jgi:hypothetical protein
VFAICGVFLVSVTAGGLRSQGLLSGRPKEQKLVLIQLVEETIVNPNGKAAAEELISERLLKRSHGMHEVFSSGVCKIP